MTPACARLRLIKHMDTLPPNVTIGAESGRVSIMLGGVGRSLTVTEARCVANALHAAADAAEEMGR